MLCFIGTWIKALCHRKLFNAVKHPDPLLGLCKRSVSSPRPRCNHSLLVGNSMAPCGFWVSSCELWIKVGLCLSTTVPCFSCCLLCAWCSKGRRHSWDSAFVSPQNWPPYCPSLLTLQSFCTQGCPGQSREDWTHQLLLLVSVPEGLTLQGRNMTLWSISLGFRMKILKNLCQSFWECWPAR